MRSRILFTLFFILFFYFNAHAYYKNAVIGFGHGVHFFSRDDEVRGGEHKQKIKNENEFPSTTAAIQAYLDIYLTPGIAVGYRPYQVIGYKRTKYTDEATGVEGDLSETTTYYNNMVTLTFMEIEPEMGRWGFMVGLGSIEYKYKIEQRGFSGLGFEDTNEVYETKGTAQLLNVFYDLGMDVWGSRIGVQSYTTDLDRLVIDQESDHTIYAFESAVHELNASGSGLTYYVDLRFAF